MFEARRRKIERYRYGVSEGLLAPMWRTHLLKLSIRACTFCITSAPFAMPACPFDLRAEPAAPCSPPVLASGDEANVDWVEKGEGEDDESIGNILPVSYRYQESRANVKLEKCGLL